MQTDVHYCYHCFQWVLGPTQWEEHCGDHLQNLQSQTCGTMTHCHALVRPGYCPFCLGKPELSNSRRLESWCRDHSLWQYIDQHLQELTYPCPCPHPLCNSSVEGAQQLQHRFIDKHGLSRTMPKENMSNSNVVRVEQIAKRKSCNDLVWMANEFSSHETDQKKLKQCSTVAPSSLLLENGVDKEYPQPTSEAATSLILDESPSAFRVHSFQETKQDPLGSPVRSIASEDYGSITFATNEDAVSSQFMRSPSPDLGPGVSLADDGNQPRINMPSVIQPNTIADNDDAVSHLEVDTACIANIVSTRTCRHRPTLRFNPPKTKIVLHVANKPNRRQTAPKVSNCKKSASRIKRSRQHSKAGGLTRNRQRQLGRQKTWIQTSM